MSALATKAQNAQDQESPSSTKLLTPPKTDPKAATNEARNAVGLAVSPANTGSASPKQIRARLNPTTASQSANASGSMESAEPSGHQRRKNSTPTPRNSAGGPATGNVA